MQPTAIAAAVALSALLLASGVPPAHADSQDDAYLKALAEVGITSYPADKLVTVGHMVCAYKSAGAAPWQTQNGLMGYGIAPQDLDAVVSTAVDTYCP
ncbi:DUF732 domain-containing protein [Mycobacterium branderi]|uniref:DUF732 domain-containing protein n=1 Tax=Mycobacterium branderi TaxID=43348 RepID=A0A7I7W859_9MYCO|nr:DUF732 domain-containing protein [Mycobacterium branderi]MCV7234135.1 DUF732 domain-containing protein [Mycobacterium branderi]ORA36871.1 hypothetical protein BST20_14710 [Mycobacterium branderi]BBZ13779.1 hypothetical protein MBRA_39740 [Mycobacterium branderi]